LCHSRRWWRGEAVHELGEAAGEVDGGAVLEVRPEDLDADREVVGCAADGATVAGR